MLVHAVAPYYAQGAEPTERDARFQELVYALKDGRRWRHRSGIYVDPAEVIARYVARHGSPVLGSERLLVPMPRSIVTPERIRASRWPALRLERALTDIGLGDGVEAVVRRTTTIRSSRANPHDRPTVVEQIAALDVGYFDLMPFNTIVLIDDVVTRGTIFAAAEAAMRATGWDGTIEAFAAGWTWFHGDGEGTRAALFRVEWSGTERYPRRVLVSG